MSEVWYAWYATSLTRLYDHFITYVAAIHLLISLSTFGVIHKDLIKVILRLTVVDKYLHQEAFLIWMAVCISLVSTKLWTGETF